MTDEEILDHFYEILFEFTKHPHNEDHPVTMQDVNQVIDVARSVKTTCVKDFKMIRQFTLLYLITSFTMQSRILHAHKLGQYPNATYQFVVKDIANNVVFDLSTARFVDDHYVTMYRKEHSAYPRQFFCRWPTLCDVKIRFSGVSRGAEIKISPSSPHGDSLSDYYDLVKFFHNERGIYVSRP